MISTCSMLAEICNQDLSKITLIIDEGIFESVLKLLHHQNSEIRKQAIRCVKSVIEMGKTWVKDIIMFGDIDEKLSSLLKNVDNQHSIDGIFQTLHFLINLEKHVFEAIGEERKIIARVIGTDIEKLLQTAFVNVTKKRTKLIRDLLHEISEYKNA